MTAAQPPSGLTIDAPAIPGRRKLLFVCAQNRNRSFTAEQMFRRSRHYDVRSRGVARDARIRLTESDIRWADAIFVMEKNHKNRITKAFRPILGGKKIVCLFIDDVYDPMEEALVQVLRERLAPHLVLPDAASR